MKNLIFSYFFIIFTVQGFSQWNWQHPLPNGLLHKRVQFTDSQTGYSLSAADLLKTTDGGLNWFIVSSDPELLGQHFDFVNSSKGFISVHNKMKRTLDGGATWQQIQLPCIQDVAAFQFVDDLHGFAVSEDAFMSTNDGGTSWQAHPGPGPGPKYLCFLTKYKGYVCGSNWFKVTGDGGVSWQDKDKCHEEMSCFRFFDFQSGLSGTDQGYICRTVNGAQDWTTVYSSVYSHDSIHDIFFLNKDTCFVAGNNIILKSTDGGLTWHKTDSSYIDYYSISFRNNNEGYAVGKYGIISRTTNCGETWHVINSITNEPLRKIQFTDPAHGYICSRNNILKTTDYGATWDTTFALSGRKFYSIFFFDHLNGFAGCDSGLILHTTDGGNTWTEKYLGPDYHNVTALYFTSSLIGFCGSDFPLAKTTDGGLTWTVYPDPYLTGVISFSFPTGTTGFALAPYNFKKTINAGASWIALDCGYECRQVFFTDSLNGYYINYQDLMKTIDGGMTWDPIQLPLPEPQGLQFLTPDLGYIVCNGGILRTLDGGATFDNISPHYFNWLEQCYFHDSDTGYICGHGGSIMKIRNASLISDIPHARAVKSDISIFPNPAQEFIKVESTSEQDVSIYELTGRMVMTSRVHQGKNEINISQFKTGIYILRSADTTIKIIKF